MKFDELIRTRNNEISLLVGNGINRYMPHAGNSWDDLLVSLAHSYGLPLHDGQRPAGVSPTEFFDVLALAKNAPRAGYALQKAFAEKIGAWEPQAQHRAIVGWAQRNNVPVLTTNFDDLLSKAGKLELRAVPGKLRFTRYYPWNVCYTNDSPTDIARSFGVWHINGMRQYPDSIRLGLSHYMGSVSRTRPWLHEKHEDCLFHGKDQVDWVGSNTWLHVIFNRSLAIFGVTLDENEVFLRWLLLERAKYFKQFPDRRCDGWYFYLPKKNSKDENQGKLFFLRQVGIMPVPIGDRAEIYAPVVWGG